MFTATFAHFIIHTTPEVGALQRLINTIRKRGFRIDSMMAVSHPSDQGFRIEVRLEGPRSFETLARQLSNQLDIVSLSVMAQQAFLSEPAPETTSVVV